MFTTFKLLLRVLRPGELVNLQNHGICEEPDSPVSTSCKVWQKELHMLEHKRLELELHM